MTQAVTITNAANTEQIVLTTPTNTATLILKATVARTTSLFSQQTTGAALTGSQNDPSGRTMTLSDVTIASFVVIDNSTLTETNDFSVSGTTLTFLKRILDSQKITVYGI